MKKESFVNTGVLYSISASIWWGVIQVVYFKMVSFVNPTEVLAVRIITSVVLLFPFIIWSKSIYEIRKIRIKKYFFILFLTSLFICGNWFLWITAIGLNQVVEASMGYYITPLFKAVLGFLIFREKLSKWQLVAFVIAALGVLNLFVQYGSVPVITLGILLTFGFYGALRKKTEVTSQIGLFCELTFALPLAFVIYIWIGLNNIETYFLSDISVFSLLFLSGFITVVPLFLYVKGIQKIKLATAGIIFYITPTLQFLVGVLIYGEELDFTKITTLILIWISVFIYSFDSLKNHKETNN